VAIDRPSNENVETQRATDAPPPPPPPDRPGEEGFPSRAESRAAAAAAIDRIQERDQAGENADTTAPDTAGEDLDDTRDATAGSSAARGRDAPEDREDDASDALTDSDHEPADESADAGRSEPASETEHEAQRPNDTEEGADQRDIRQEAVTDTDCGPIDAQGDAIEEHPDRAPNPATDTPPADGLTDSGTDITQATGPDANTADSAPGQPREAGEPTELSDDLSGARPEEEHTVESTEPTNDGHTSIDEARSDDATDGTDFADRPDALGPTAEGDAPTSVDGPEPESPGMAKPGMRESRISYGRPTTESWHAPTSIATKSRTSSNVPAAQPILRAAKSSSTWRATGYPGGSACAGKATGRLAT
jgi:hypothetical protein